MKANGNPRPACSWMSGRQLLRKAVNWARGKGITTGTDATHFSPDGICTRAQAVTFLWPAGQPRSQVRESCLYRCEGWQLLL